MGIPGLQAEVEPRAKVRVGVKVATGDGSSERPASVDHFVSDDKELLAIAGHKPQVLRISLAGEVSSDCWSHGLEWWGKKTGVSGTLVCYSKGEQVQGETFALRLNEKVDEGDRSLGAVGDRRTPVLCRFRSCPHFKPGECRPMARLDFFLVGGARSAPLRFETKGFNSIEAIQGALNLCRGEKLYELEFELRVRWETSGTNRFPLVSLHRLDEGSVPAVVPSPREQLIAAIRLRGQNPRDEAVVKWVNEVGVERALEALSG